MAAKLLGPSFEIHGGGLDLVFPHHENELAQSRAAGQEFARIWMHNGLLRLTGEKMSKSLGNIQTLDAGAGRVGERDAAALLHDRALAQPDRLLARDDDGGARAGLDVPKRLPASARATGGARLGGLREPRSTNDFSTTEALAVLHEWRAAGQLELLEARFGRVRARKPGRGGAGAARARRAGSRSVRPHAPSATSPSPIASATRSRPPAGKSGTSRRSPATNSSRKTEAMVRELVYGRNAVREAVRGPRQVLELWVSERAGEHEPWLSEPGAPRDPGQARARALAGGADARAPGRRRLGRALPLRRRLRAGASRRAAARLSRPGHQPAQPRRRRPRGRGRRRDRPGRSGARLGAGHRGGLPRLGRGGRADPDRGRHQPRPLPRGDQARRPLDLRRRRNARKRRTGRPISPAAWRSSSAPRRRGCARSCAGAATTRWRSRLSARSSR